MVSLTSLNLEGNKIDVIRKIFQRKINIGQFIPIPIGHLNIKILEVSDNKLESIYSELMDARALAYIRYLYPP